jgi:SAM-dependent methyltransferase
MAKIPDYVRWHIFVREKESKGEANYIAKTIRKFLKKRSISIIEVACGNGRLHPFLRKAGFDVYGIDNSKELIEEAKQKYKKFADKYFVADMRNFELGKKFDVALSWFTSFGYFNDKGNFIVLKNINKHLKNNGILLLDMPNRIVKFNEIQRFKSYTLTEKKFFEIVFNKLEKRGREIFWILDQNFYLKRRKNLYFIKRVKTKVRLYSLKEIKNLLRKSEFKILEVFASKSFENFDEKKHNQMFIVARKVV